MTDCDICRAPACLETEGWTHQLCREHWEQAGQPGVEPIEPVFRGLREAHAFGWSSPGTTS